MKSSARFAKRPLELLELMSMGIENCRVLGTESVGVRALPRGGNGATGVGQRARSAVVMTEPLSLQAIRCLLGWHGDG